jgi:arylsulfatase A-like enzyme
VIAGLVLVAVALLVAFAVQRAALWPVGRAAAPNILLITLDTTRADRLGAYGYRLGRTPRLDRFAFEGVLFEQAVAPAPMTLPSHASLFTALYPFAHGVRTNGSFHLGETFPTLATALRGAGYRTAAFVSAFSLDRRYGLSLGFDHYDDRLEAAPRRANLELERRGDRTALAAGEWVEQHVRGSTGTAFFVWLHLYDPHEPYEAPPPYGADFADRPYDGEVAFADAVVGGVLDRLDRLDVRRSTIVAVAGDHGESLGEHGEATHAMFVYESAIRVPLMVRWPGHIGESSRVREPVRLVDVAPTLLDLAGVPALAGVHGWSLVPLVRRTGAGPPSAYSETYFPLFSLNWAPLRSIRDDRWKFIDAPSPELYDLANDPHEQANLAAREASRAVALRRALDLMTGGREGVMATRKMDRETTEMLAALGYISASANADSETAPAGRPDPKAMIDVYNQLLRANGALRDGRLEEAESVARDAMRRDPRNAFALQLLASAQMDRGSSQTAPTPTIGSRFVTFDSANANVRWPRTRPRSRSIRATPRHLPSVADCWCRWAE